MLNDIISAHIDNALSEIHTAFPAKILKYAPDKQCIDAQPLIKRRFVDGSSISMPILHSVPVIFPYGGGALFSFPLNEGDTVLIICCERSIDQWLASTGSEIDPQDTRKFNLSDAVALPGLCTLSNNATPDEKSLVIKYLKGKISIDDKSSIVIATDSNLNIHTKDDLVIQSAKSIEIKSESPLKIDCKLAEFSGDIKCEKITCQEVIAQTDVVAASVSLTKHTHVVPPGTDKPGGTTGLPI